MIFTKAVKSDLMLTLKQTQSYCDKHFFPGEKSFWKSINKVIVIDKITKLNKRQSYHSISFLNFLEPCANIAHDRLRYVLHKLTEFL